MSGDVSKLPRWAQQRIELLEQQVKRRDEEIARLENPEGRTDSNTVVRGFGRDSNIYLQPNASVMFTLDGEDDAGDRTVEAHIDGDWLEIRGVGFGHGLVVAPSVTNVIHVGIGGRR